MKRVDLYRCALFVGLAACAVRLSASATSSGFTPAPFANYQPILDRMPFGAPPAAVPVADAAPSKTDAQTQAEQQKLAKQVSMSCVNVTPDGATAIGFTDLGEKPPVNYYLLVGTAGGGWTVVAADYDEEWAQIEKDGVTITLKLGKGLIDAPPPRAAAAVAHTSSAAAAAGVITAVQPAAAAPAEAPRSGLIRRPSQTGLPPAPGLAASQMADLQKTRAELAKLKESGGDVGSYMERLRERKRLENEEKTATERAAREKLQDLARKITETELKKREREMNLSLIEQGAKPISDIELTAEEEAALVAKGVLQ